jgi:ATP-dependent DNA helicase RecG
LAPLLRPLSYARRNGWANLRVMPRLEQDLLRTAQELARSLDADAALAAGRVVSVLGEKIEKSESRESRLEKVCEVLGMAEGLKAPASGHPASPTPPRRGAPRSVEPAKSKPGQKVAESARGAGLPDGRAEGGERQAPQTTDPAAPDSFRAIKGVGPVLAEKLAARGLVRLADALTFYPLGYDDPTVYETPEALVLGRPVALRIRLATKPRWWRGLLSAKADLAGTTLELRWFGLRRPIAASLIKKLADVPEHVVFGKPLPLQVSKQSTGGWQLVHPELRSANPPPTDEPPRAVPRYPTVEGLSDARVRSLVGEAVRHAARSYVDPLPEPLIKKFGLMAAAAAFEAIHQPPLTMPVADLLRKEGAPFRRLIFDDFIYLQLALLVRKSLREKQIGVACFAGDESVSAAGLIRPFLPFEMTSAQGEALSAIEADLRRGAPMQRLLQADVGAGKTAVALGAALFAAGAGYQVALLAPTEILARQHAQTAHKWFRGSPRVELLVASLGEADKRHVRAAVARGEVGIVIGTHALLSDAVTFRRLALCIVDEQHRFGVEQRAAVTLKAQGYVPHFLALTATPIPRSLALTLFGELDVSVMRGKPPGRVPVATRVVAEADALQVEKELEQMAADGRPSFVILPLVEAGDEAAETVLKDATSHASALALRHPGLRVGLAHGRQKGDERTRALKKMATGELDVLVATTVVEVGVDVPNAGLIVIHHAERFGLAQLHQLRGRVGRDGQRAHCIAIASEGASPEALARLEAFAATDDGFDLAELDLAQRGPGDFFGTSQAGAMEGLLGMSRLAQDVDLLADAQKAAHELFALNPSPLRENILAEAERRFVSLFPATRSG